MLKPEIKLSMRRPLAAAVVAIVVAGAAALSCGEMGSSSATFTADNIIAVTSLHSEGTTTSDGLLEAKASVKVDGPSSTSSSLLTCNGNPNGTISAAKGSICMDVTAPALYQNTNGGTSWVSTAGTGITGTLTPNVFPLATGTTTVGNGPLSTNGSLITSSQNVKVPALEASSQIQVDGPSSTSAQILTCNGNPNGSISAPKGSVCMDVTGPAFYQNTNGTTGWSSATAGLTGTLTSGKMPVATGPGTLADGPFSSAAGVTTSSQDINVPRLNMTLDPSIVTGAMINCNPCTVSNTNGEIIDIRLDGSGHTTSTSDVFGMVIRNHVTFDTTGGPNASGGFYSEVIGSKTAGSAALTCSSYEAHASGCDTNYSFVSYAGSGTFRFDSGGSMGPVTVSGSIGQTGGNVAFNAGAGTAAITAATTTITSALNQSGGAIDMFGAATFESTLRVNGSSVNFLAAAPVFMTDMSGNGAPIKTRETEAYVPDRLSSNGAASLITGVTFLSGAGVSDTLAAGTKDGQTKRFVVTSGSGTLTPSALYGGTSYSWTSTPAGITLVWDATGTKWGVLAVSNMTLNP